MSGDGNNLFSRITKVKLLLFGFLWKHKGNGGVVPLILNLGGSWRWAVSLTTRPIYPRGKYQRRLLSRRMAGLHVQFGPYGGKRKYLLLPTEIEFRFLVSFYWLRRRTSTPPTPPILLYTAYMAYVNQFRVLVFCEGYHVGIIDNISVNRRVWGWERSIVRYNGRGKR